MADKEKMIVPKDVQDDAKRMAEEDKIPLDRIIEYMREEYFDEALILVYPDPKANNGERAIQALMAARARVASEKGDEDTEYKGIVLIKGPVECDVSKKGNEYTFRDVYGVFSKDDEKPHPVKIRLFGDAVQQIDDLPAKTPLKINLSENDTKEYGLSLAANKLFWQKIEGEFDIRATLTKLYGEKKTVNEMEFTRTEKDDDGESKTIIMECRVKSVNINVSQKGYKYLSLGVYSDEDGPDKIAYVRAPLSMAVCDIKSLIWVIGKNTLPQKGFEDKKASIWADMIYPIVVFPMSSVKLDAMIENAVKRADSRKNVKKSNDKLGGEDAPDVGNIEEVDEGDGWGDGF